MWDAMSKKLNDLQLILGKRSSLPAAFFWGVCNEHVYYNSPLRACGREMGPVSSNWAFGRL